MCLQKSNEKVDIDLVWSLFKKTKINYVCFVDFVNEFINAELLIVFEPNESKTTLAYHFVHSIFEKGSINEVFNKIGAKNTNRVNLQQFLAGAKKMKLKFDQSQLTKMETQMMKLSIK